ncbi:SDR family oxidoreductase [Streptomyces sp. AK02-04a]|uniref:SDR family oxidoreductase n=1 Tax=Streptomyces sp. AK02-04a TaxID=3028649 RepID=UPI0029AA9A17|nr:SDR family oxidoreductase [Streptomyces sp. AK02-04a]MDX3764014.1 SDR family oxidoreductase [Streptomyces sp. AK02-04a]
MRSRSSRGVETDMATQYCSKYINPKLATKISKEDWLAAHGALGRLAQAPEIASGYAFLASDDAAYMTGRTLQIDGG